MEPIKGFWRWRKIYAVYLIGTGLVFLPSISRSEFAVLALFPIFHLIITALIAELMIAMIAPDLAVAVPLPSLSAPVPVVAAAVGVVLALFVARRAGLPSVSISLPFIGGDEDPEYEITMTEVWKSGGRND